MGLVVAGSLTGVPNHARGAKVLHEGMHNVAADVGGLCNATWQQAISHACAHVRHVKRAGFKAAAHVHSTLINDAPSRMHSNPCAYGSHVGHAVAAVGGATRKISAAHGRPTASHHSLAIPSVTELPLQIVHVHLHPKDSACVHSD